MKKGLIVALAMLSAILVISSTITTSPATDYSKVGVREGDTVDYSVSYYSTSPDSPESEYYPSWIYNKVHIDVSGVMGANVSLYITYSFPDQRMKTEIYNADISRQGCNYLTVAGLEVGDPVFIGAYTTVKETIAMTILGTERLVNVVELSRALDKEIILYYEKETGILVKSLRSSLGFGWMVERIASTPVTPESQVDPVTAAVTVVASIAIAAMILTTFAVMDRRRRD